MSLESKKIRLIMDLRNGGVSDHSVLAAMEQVPREVFVEETFLDKAYSDQALPISCGQTISQPLVVGLMTQALTLTDRHKVLEIGTGSGYQAAILSRLCRRLYTVERHRDLLSAAEQRFQALNYHNITTMLGDGWAGWPNQAPFDRIIVTAAARLVPEDLLAQLKEGGVMVIPVGEENALSQELLRITRTADGLETERMFPVRFVPMVEGAVPSSAEGA